MLKFKEFIKEGLFFDDYYSPKFPHEVVSKFYKFVYSNEDFDLQNKILSERDERGDLYEDSEEGYSFLLLSKDIIDKSVVPVCENLNFEYFIMFVESTIMSRDVKFWVYRDSEFVEPTKDEDLCLYNNDQEKDFLGRLQWANDPNLHHMHYWRWKEYQEKTVKSFKNFNK